MKKLVFATALVGAVAALAGAASADNAVETGKFSVAVFGDWPYSTNLANNANLLINSINSDSDIRFVIHVGDIHSGSMPCTSAGILPALSGANPGWNQQIYFDFQQFGPALVYTPGDNEWTDCHKSKEGASGAPMKELASVRSLFFARPGHTLGLKDKEVWTQAQHNDPSHPEDAAFVENVMWEHGRLVFVTLNLPGSNNDTVPWTGNFADPTTQANEVALRTAADIRWLQSAFATAERDNARAVVIATQADMWDPAQLASGGDGLNAYDTFVQALADAAQHFGKPVLLLNGDSHLFEADHPLSASSPTTLAIHGTQAVENLLRITVQGSTNAPAEWLKLTFDGNKRSVFNWTNVPYCQTPAGNGC